MMVDIGVGQEFHFGKTKGVLEIAEMPVRPECGVTEL